MHKLQLFFLVDEFVLSKAPWAVEFLPQTLQKTAPEQWVWISFGQLAVRFQSYATQRDCGVPVGKGGYCFNIASFHFTPSIEEVTETD